MSLPPSRGNDSTRPDQPDAAPEDRADRQTSQPFPDSRIRLVLSWLNTQSSREERRFLEQHSDLLDPASDAILASLAQQYAAHAERRRDLLDHLALLRDIRSRQQRVAALDAIRQGYVNWRGGLALDVPSWLEEAEQRLAWLWTQSRMSLLREAVQRAKSEHLTPEVIADLHTLIWHAQNGYSGPEQHAMREEGLAALHEALAVYTLKCYPVQYGAIQNNMGATYWNRVTGDRRDNLERAIAAYSETLHVYTIDAFPVEYATTQYNLGAAYWKRIEGDRHDNQEQAITALSEALRVRTLDAYPTDFATTQFNLGTMYWERIGGERSENLEQAIAAYEEALRVYTIHAFPQDYAKAQNNLGAVFQKRIAGQRRENLEQALAAHTEALRVFTFDAFPADYAGTQYNLGNTYAERIAGERRENIERAIAAYSEALRVFTADAFPVQYATNQYNLGDAFQRRMAGERRENLERAIAAFSEALRVYTLDAFPVDYATTQYSLGTAFQERIAGDRRDNLERAIVAYTKALRVHTIDTYPTDYAATQADLGTAYTKRVAGNRRDNVERAIAAYTEALRVYTLDAFPILYAAIQNNLGTAYADRMAGERKDNLDRAIEAFSEALRVRTIDAFPVDYARTQNNLGTAYADRMAGDRRDNLERAIKAFSEALRVCVFDASPTNYAMIQNNLGNILLDRIAGEREDNIERAIEAYTEALRVYTLDAFPVQYAMTQHNLGNAYADRVAGDRHENLARAIAAYEEALRVRTIDAFPADFRMTQQNRAFTEAELERWDRVAEAYGAALEAEDLLLALAGGVDARDAVLRDGREAAIRAGYALARAGRISEAAVTIERGRARDVAEALAQDAADPTPIRDPDRRARFTQARDALRTAQAALNAAISLDPSTLPEDAQERAWAIEQRRRQVEMTRAEAFRAAKAAYDAIVGEIRQAHDPEDFAYAPLDASAILHAAACARPGHAVVYLAATPWGGMAVAALDAIPRPQTSPRFAALPLPSLTDQFTRDLIERKLASGQTANGLAFAQEGSAFTQLAGDWKGTTMRQRAEALRAACAAEGVSSTFDRAAHYLLRQPATAPLMDLPLVELFSNARHTDRMRLEQTFNHLVLLLELDRCLPALADAALRPLARWLSEQGASSVTLIPCGMLAAFPLGAVEVAPGRAFAEVLPASVAPNARVLLRDQRRSGTERSGVYAVGDPRPTHQALEWGEAEALTITRIARLLGQTGEAKTQEQARRDWLIEKLRTGWMVDASCHGGFNPASPLDSHLQLAEGERGRLTLRDMMSHVADLRGLRLLILSACETGMLDLRGARDEVRSLAVGTLQAGAEATMAASWAVDDRATYLLMVRFAQEWLPRMSTEPPALALARAQEWLRRARVAELRQWQALSMPEVTTKERAEEVVVVQVAQELVAHLALASARNGEVLAVRGRGSRYDISQAEGLIRTEAERWSDEQGRPYAHPYFWAGFQVYGW